MEKKLKFGDTGTWHKPASDDSKAKDIRATILEHCPEGCLYIFTEKPIKRGYNNLHWRTATISPSDFSLDK